MLLQDGKNAQSTGTLLAINEDKKDMQDIHTHNKSAQINLKGDQRLLLAHILIFQITELPIVGHGFLEFIKENENFHDIMVFYT